MNRTPTSEAFGQDPWKARIDRVFARALVLPLLLALGLLALLLLALGLYLPLLHKSSG